MSGLTVPQMARLPWTFQGPRFMQPRPDETYFELRIAELPDFFIAGESVEEVLNGLPSALHAFLQSYVDAGETPPLPQDRSRWQVTRPDAPHVRTPPNLLRVAENLSFR